MQILSTVDTVRWKLIEPSSSKSLQHLWQVLYGKLIITTADLNYYAIIIEPSLRFGVPIVLVNPNSYLELLWNCWWTNILTEAIGAWGARSIFQLKSYITNSVCSPSILCSFQLMSELVQIDICVPCLHYRVSMSSILFNCLRYTLVLFQVLSSNHKVLKQGLLLATKNIAKTETYCFIHVLIQWDLISVS